MSLPSLETLATLAAAMSSPAEEPEATAARALALWRASDIALRQAVFLDTQKRGHALTHLDAIAEFDVFLGECLGRDMSSDVPAENETAPLRAVLKALMPQKTLAERTAKWRAMRRQNVIDDDEARGLPKRNEEDLETAVAEVMERDRVSGFAVRDLAHVRHCFERFDEADRLMVRSDKGKHAAAVKRKKAAAKKKTLGGQKSSTKAS